MGIGRGRSWVVSAAVLGGLWAAAVAAEPGASAAPRAPDAGPRIGLVLSGGGARGGAHLGVLKVLEELRVPVHAVVGTSAGSIVGAAYASGMPVAAIEADMRGLSTGALFRDVEYGQLPIARKAEAATNYIGPEVGWKHGGLALRRGAVAGVALEAVLRRLTVRQRSERFDALPIPFRAIATDLESGEMVVLDRGNLALAVRASMALPAIVNPVEIDGRLLVDGGLVRNVPVDVARAMGVDVVIVVDIGTPLRVRRELDSLFAVTDQMVRILTDRNVRQSLSEVRSGDVLITPELGDIASAEFDRLLEAAAAGESAARAMSAGLRRYSLPPEAWARHAAQRHAGEAPVAVVDAVRVDGAERVPEEAVRRALGIQPGMPFDAERAEAGLRRVYGTGDFEAVGYVLLPQPDGHQILEARVREKSWGPNYLRIGLEMSSDFQGNTSFSLLAAHRRAWLNRRGGEWRNEAQTGRIDRLRTLWHQPLDLPSGWFVEAQLAGEREPFDVYLGEQRVFRLRRGRSIGELSLGHAAGSTRELRLSLSGGHVRLVTDTGIVNDVVPRTRTGAVALRLRLDHLDNPRFPRDGAALDLAWEQSRPGLGAAERFQVVDAALRGAWAHGRHTLNLAWLETRSLGEEPLPVWRLRPLGGFLRLSGHPEARFIARDARLLRAVLQRELVSAGLLDGTRLGLSLEHARFVDALGAGSGAQQRWSSALFLSTDTPLGPLHLGHGRAPGGVHATFFYLGFSP